MKDEIKKIDPVLHDLFICINEGIEKFSKLHPKIFEEKGYTQIAVNALCMLSATFLDKFLENKSYKEKEAELKKIYKWNEKYLKYYHENPVRDH